MTLRSFHECIFSTISISNDVAASLNLSHTHAVLTSDVPADVLHSTRVVMMPVCDDDLLDAGVELLQYLFQIADVFWHGRFASVYQHSPGIWSHITNNMHVKGFKCSNLYSCTTILLIYFLLCFIFDSAHTQLKHSDVFLLFWVLKIFPSINCQHKNIF